MGQKSINIETLEKLQELRKLLEAFDNGTVEFPLNVWWAYSAGCWVVNVPGPLGHRWCLRDDRVVDFDFDAQHGTATRRNK